MCINGELRDPGLTDFGVPHGRLNGKLVAFADETAFVNENDNIDTFYYCIRDLYLQRMWFDRKYIYDFK